MKPIILITPRIDEHNSYAVSRNYINALNNEGANCIICSYENPDEIDEILSIAHGILLTGGGDIDSTYFGEKLDERSNSIFKERDEYEIKLCQKAVEKNIPLLGICRGEQVLNVAMGGSLIQHVDNHVVDGADGTDLMHNVTMVKNQCLETMYGKDEVGVNSVHHQAIGKLGAGLTTLCYSTCGLVEGIKHEKCDFVIGVQFHPEIIVAEHQEHRIIFKKFVDASIKYKNGR